jgi:hypothetical protein
MKVIAMFQGESAWLPRSRMGVVKPIIADLRWDGLIAP